MSDMTYTRMGKSGLVVSRLALGTMTFTHGSDWIPGVAKVGLSDAQRMVDTALDGGINFFDAADGYSNGEAEDILGKTLKGKRNDAVICTKLGFRQSDRITDAGLSRGHILSSIDGCLKRLRHRLDRPSGIAQNRFYNPTGGNPVDPANGDRRRQSAPHRRLQLACLEGCTGGAISA